MQKRTKLSIPAGMSKQAVSKRRALEQIRDGSFIRDPNRWETFKLKIMQIDVHAEIPDDPSCVLSVKHSRCGSWLCMAAPYDTDRFKTHAKSCTLSTAAGKMKTLENFGVFSLPTKGQISPSSTQLLPSPTSVAFPCLGLTEKDDPRILQYLTRTSVASAGGKNVHDVARELFSADFKDLSPEDKNIVRQKQMLTHSWSVDRTTKSVHAIRDNPCEGVARQGNDGTLQPCVPCFSLLTLRVFRNAISREVPENENRVYIPHIYQSAEVGKLYGLGLIDLIDGVRLISQL
jgi:hypothetical protein